ncbi:hypothetical protein ACOME3_000542 [Neoechinorhynchus agilis]
MHSPAEIVNGAISEWDHASYADLIEAAIENSLTGRLRVNEIYVWIQENFPYFKQGTDSKSWKGAIRNTLSFCRRFRKIPVRGRPRKSFWAISDSITSGPLWRPKGRQQIVEELRIQRPHLNGNVSEVVQRNNSRIYEQENQVMANGHRESGGKWLSNSLRVSLSSEPREQLLFDSGTTPSSQLLLEDSQKQRIPQQSTTSIGSHHGHLVYPIKRWPHILTIKSSPIMPKDVIYKHSVVPWARSFKNYDVKRIDHVTYYGGILRVCSMNHDWLSSLKEFSSFNLQHEVYSVESATQKVQFLANGLQPDLAREDKKEFEKPFSVKIKFFLNSRNTGSPISIAMVESSRQVRDDLCERLAYQQ